jgi:hypothetical protein
MTGNSFESDILGRMGGVVKQLKMGAAVGLIASD